MLFLLAACGAAPEPPGELIFLRDAVLVPGAVDGGRQVGGGRNLVERDWTPGESVSVGAWTGTGPVMAECLSLFSVDLGDLDSLVAMGREAPDTALAFSPDGSRLAVGTYLGAVMVLDGWTGEVLARRGLAETLVKRLAWSADGSVLYAGEQSPDAALHALDATSLETRWSRILADEVGRSPMPAGEEKHGIYELPATYGLEVLEGGDILVAATHSWTAAEGRRENRSRLLRLSPRGETVAGWPSQAAAITLLRLRVSESGDLAALSVGHSADDPPPPGLPVHGVQVLRTADLSPVSQHTVEPLAPWFTSSWMWEAMDVSDAQGVLMGFGDGRVHVQSLEGETRLALTTGAPIMAGEVPIAASVAFGLFAADRLVFTTAGTNIPWGAASPELKPPMAHPNANALWVHDASGELQWTWTGSHQLNGLAATGDTLLAVAGERRSDERQDLFGALLFDLAADKGSGSERLVATCATPSPPFFKPAAAADGRVALAELPWRKADGSVAGSYRVTVLR